MEESKDYKKCTFCFFHKPLAQFPKNSKGLFGRGQKCKACSAILAANYRKEHPMKKAAIKYKVEEHEVARIWTSKNCEICGASPKDGKRLCIDHNHTTGKLRGLLCDKCNTGLGMYKENITLLKKAITYLERTNE